MTIRRWALLVLMLASVVQLRPLSSSTVRAQDSSPQASLSRAPLAALLQSIPETVALAQKEYTSDYGGLNPLQLDLLTEIENRYTEAELSAQSYEALRNAYQALNVASEEANVGTQLWSSPQRWTQALIAAWLHEHPVDLEHTGAIPDLSATVTAHDLNGDGTDEYILFVNADYIGYFVLQHEGSGYRFVDTPLPFGLSGATYWTSEAGSFVDMGFTKNGYDGLPEWHILFGGLSCSNCFLNYGTLYVLAWRNDHLVDIVSSGSDNQAPLSYEQPLVLGTDDVRPQDVQWDFSADQIVQTQLLRDSWQCHWHDRTVYQWDKALHLYLYESKTTTYDDSFACAQRVAESAMWHHDYQAAIFIYERALQRDQNALTVSYDDVFPDVTKEAIQYAQARLALAYSLTGQDTKAEVLAAQVRAQTPTSDMMAGVISALSNIPNQYPTCAALYNLFAGYAKSDYSYSVPGNLVVGTVQDNFFPSSMHTDPVSPENAGCDVDALLNLGGRTGLYFPISDDPVARLRDQGIDVASSIHADLDGDGHEDWIIWLTAQVEPIFLKSGTQAYQVSRVHINQPRHLGEITTVYLPNGTSAVVELYQRPAQFTSSMDEMDINGTYACPPLNDQKFHPIQTLLDLWQMVDGTLQNTLTVPFCEKRSLDQLFPNSTAGSTISAWIPGSQSSIDSYMTQLDQGAYVWNGTTYTIVSAPSSSTRSGSTLPAVLVNSHSTSALTDDDFNDVFRSLHGEYLNHNYLQVASGGYIALRVAPADADPFILDAIRYYRALSLQFLGQSDDATRELQALALKRDSAWTTLADLHLAPANSK